MLGSAMSSGPLACRPLGAVDAGRYLELLSHELRTPATSIHAAATVLRAQAPRLDEELRAELVRDISEESERLMRAISDVLTLAQLDAGLGLQREPLLLQRIVPPLLRWERRRRPHVGLELRELGSLPLVAGDEGGIRLLLQNLLAETEGSDEQPISVELSVLQGTRGVQIRITGGQPRADDRGPTLAGYTNERVARAMGGWTETREHADGRADHRVWLPGFDQMNDDWT
jgi:K+-sensing histidine kinase KdpD